MAIRTQRTVVAEKLFGQTGLEDFNREAPVKWVARQIDKGRRVFSYSFRDEKTGKIDMSNEDYFMLWAVPKDLPCAVEKVRLALLRFNEMDTEHTDACTVVEVTLKSVDSAGEIEAGNLDGHLYFKEVAHG